MIKTRRFILALLLCTAMLFAMASAVNAEDAVTASGSCGDNVTWTLYESGKLTISGTGPMTDYSSSSSVPWYSSRSSVKTVEIAGGVTSIGRYAFDSCSSLGSVTIPSSVTSIGDDAFAHCSSLGSVTIPSGVTSIGDDAFYYCSSLGSVAIPSSVTSIGDDAFYSCISLGSVTIPSGVTSIGDDAFGHCISLGSVTIPSGVTSIGAGAFADCDALTEIKVASGNSRYAASAGVLYTKDMKTLVQVPAGKSGSFTIPNSVTGIDSCAFSGCAGLTSVSIPSSVTSIGDYAFIGCRSLGSVTIPSSVTSIGGNAFYGCFGLTSVSIPNSVTVIESSTFYGCRSLTSVTIPDSVVRIVHYAFAACESLKTVYFTGPAPTIGANVFEYVTATAYYPAGDSTWTADKLKNHGGKITWVAASKPTITAQPKSCTVAEGGSASFTVEASGSNLSYQWYCRSSSTGSWVKCQAASARTATHTPAALPKYSGYQYKCVISNSMGSVTSDIVTLTVVAKPTITAQPKSCTVAEGGSASFTVEVSGSNLSYQWYCRSSSTGSWVKCQAASAKTATHKPAALPKYSGYQYKCVVTNAAGSVTSNIVTLTVVAKPTITAQPKDCTVNEGGSASFTVEASGSNLSYQWYCRSSSTGSWVKCQAASAKTATHKPAALPKYSGYQYKCIISRTVNGVTARVTSNIVTLTVVAKPVITTQPTNQTVVEGKKATFKVVVTGAASYQWYYQKPGESTWTKVSSNGTSATYTLTTAARHNGYKYRCKATNTAGSVYSNVVTLTVISQPVITTQPKNVSVTAGNTATFKVAATGGGLSYQWWYLKPGTTTWVKVSVNGTSATYTLTTAARHNGYQYKCVVTNAAGSATSNIVKLTVK